MVWSGESLKSARQSIEVKVTKSGVARGVMQVPTYFYIISRTGIDKVDELTRTSEDELSAMAKILDGKILEGLERAGRSLPTRRERIAA